VLTRMLGSHLNAILVSVNHDCVHQVQHSVIVRPNGLVLEVWVRGDCGALRGPSGLQFIHMKSILGSHQ
jgi:hypothetical protein